MNILIAEDEPHFRKTIVQALARYGNVYECTDLPSATAILNTQNIDTAFIDLSLTGKILQYDGLEIVKLCSKKNITSIVLTSHEEKSIISQAYSLGCHHYFSKFDFQDNIHKTVAPLLGANKTKIHNILKNDFITHDPSLISTLQYLLQQAQCLDQNVMITGPTGVGKTKIAKILHNLYDPRSPFVHINLSELPENLIESELFGHKRGAFTGATADKMGLIEKADGGILFLDEIGTIPTNLQKKLLKVIEKGTVTPIGHLREKRISFKLLTATCDDLASKIHQGSFRVDFYFRIKGIEIHIPPLSQRRRDIFPIIDHIIDKSPKKVAFDRSAEKAMTNYGWCGNVRELENTLKELIAMSQGLITLDHLPRHIVENVSPFSLREPQTDGPLLNARMQNIIKAEGLPSLVKKIEHEAFNSVMNEAGGHINEASRRLKISKSLLYRIQKEAQSPSPTESSPSFK